MICNLALCQEEGQQMREECNMNTGKRIKIVYVFCEFGEGL